MTAAGRRPRAERAGPGIRRSDAGVRGSGSVAISICQRKLVGSLSAIIEELSAQLAGSTKLVSNEE